jgi:hypothetical protein
MTELLAWTGTWLRRLLLLTAIVMAVQLLAPQLAGVRAGFGNLAATFSSLPKLTDARTAAGNLVRSRTLALEQRYIELEKLARADLEREHATVGSRLEAARRSQSRSAVARAIYTGDGLTDALTAQIDLVFLEHEHALLGKLLDVEALHVDWQDQVQASRRCEQARVARNDFLRDSSILIRVLGSPERITFERLDARWQRECDLYLELRRAFVAGQASSRARQWLDGRAGILAESTNSVLAPLDDRISTLEKSWAGRLRDEFFRALPIALVILLGLPIAVLLTRGAFFFLAQFAAGRPAIRLLPDAIGTIEPGGRASGHGPDRAAISAVSQSIVIDEAQELLVHPEYLQSSSLAGTKDTQWLLDWRYPLSSLAAGMVALTRIRATPAESFVISATRDPFSELGVITLPSGSALAFQPHNLAGVVQPRDRPLRITRHWRLTSLSAWLTLQLRYLVFHGPATQIVKGCRGIRVEPAGQGRSIDQAATIGFSANLSYSMTRCETFGAYLLGKRGLFNDHFAGGPGSYVYEEIPHFGKKAGIIGRGLEGVVDAVRKAFGV